MPGTTFEELEVVAVMAATPLSSAMVVFMGDAATTAAATARFKSSQGSPEPAPSILNGNNSFGQSNKSSSTSAIGRSINCLKEQTTERKYRLLSLTAAIYAGEY